MCVIKNNSFTKEKKSYKNSTTSSLVALSFTVLCLAHNVFGRRILWDYVLLSSPGNRNRPPDGRTCEVKAVGYCAAVQVSRHVVREFKRDDICGLFNIYFLDNLPLLVFDFFLDLWKFRSCLIDPLVMQVSFCIDFNFSIQLVLA